MANINATAIRTRIREVLDDGEGLVRTVSAGELSGDYWDGMPTRALRARTIQKPQFAIPYIPKVPKTGAGALTEIGDTQIYEIEPTLIVAYDLRPYAEQSGSIDEDFATAEQDVDVIRQALGWPDNLDQTKAGTPTGIIDGWLRYLGDEVLEQNVVAQLLRIQIRFRGHVQVTLATS